MAPVCGSAQETLRKQIIEMVLATDMKQHFAIHSMFQAKMQLNGSVPSGGNGSGGKTMRASPHPTSQDGHKVVDEDQRSLVLQVSRRRPLTGLGVVEKLTRRPGQQGHEDGYGGRVSTLGFGRV